MKKNKIDREVEEHFKERPFFRRDELFNFYKKYEEDLNIKTFGWHVFDLKKKNIIITVRRGIYKISNKKEFNPVVDTKLKKIVKYLEQVFHELDYIVWTTQWINNLSLHMMFRNFYIVEVPYDQTESTFGKLKEFWKTGVYYHPDKSTMYNYVIEDDDPIIVKTLIQRSPIKRRNMIKTPPLEKILVDLYCDDKVFYMYQGSELKEIFRNGFAHYVINFTKLINYARRRGREKEIQEYINKNFAYLVEGGVNDQG
jgi:hypothetical protein